MNIYRIFYVVAPKLEPCHTDYEAKTMYEAVNRFYEEHGLSAATAFGEYPRVVKIITL